MSEVKATEQKAPLRDVRHDLLRFPLVTGAFRVLTLSCGHNLLRQPAQKVPKRARCQECAQ